MRQLAGVAVTSSLLLLFGCGTSATTSPPTDDPGQMKAQLGLNWYPDAQHGGFYAADALGIYAENQLQVTILPGQPAVPVMQNVAMRRVEFGIANADQVLMARAQGMPVVAVFAAMQTSPRCIMVHRESGITSLRELNQITLALGAGKAFAKFLEAEVDLSQVKIVPYTGSIAPFLADKSFAQQAYVFSEPMVVRNEGADPVTLLVSDLGFNPYTSCLITHEATIRDRPELVRAMVRSVQQGWLRYFEDATATHERIERENSQMDLPSLDFGLQALRPLCLPEGLAPESFGTMAPERWRTLAEQLQKLQLIDDASAWNSAFDTSFLISSDATHE